MKKKFIMGILCFCLLLPAAGCSSDAGTRTQSEDVPETASLSEPDQEEDDKGPGSYEELIAAARESIQKWDEPIPENYDFSSALVSSGYYDQPIRGYLIEDIDGNGTDELIFGENGTNPDGTLGGIIYDIYTISGGELVHVLNGWVRNRYYLCDNGMIANEGSSGAADSDYTYFTFEGSRLHLVESVKYDGMRDADNPWFYSTESEYDAENAEPISKDRAMEIMGKYTYKSPTFIPFVEDH